MGGIFAVLFLPLAQMQLSITETKIGPARDTEEIRQARRERRVLVGRDTRQKVRKE